MAETGLTIKILVLIVNPTSHHDEGPLYRRKENNSLQSELIAPNQKDVFTFKSGDPKVLLTHCVRIVL